LARLLDQNQQDLVEAVQEEFYQEEVDNESNTER
jgi:hypothetical protein